MRRRVLACLLSGLTLCACGPTVATQLGVQRYASNVALGIQAQAPAPTPVPGAVLQPGFPPFIAAPIEVNGPPPVAVHVPPLFPCPSAPPNAAASPAPPEVDAPPQPGGFLYRQGGFYQAGVVKVPPAQHVIRTVQNIKDNSAAHDGSDVTYDLVVDQGVSVTTTTYEVVKPTNNTLAAVNANASGGGIYITHIVTTYPHTTSGQPETDEFIPTPRIEFAPLPMIPNTTFDSSGADASHSEEMDISGTVVGHKQVNACGTVYDAWEISVTGHILAPSGPPGSAGAFGSGNRDLNATYDIATEFGGLSIQDSVATTGATPADQGILLQSITATINSITPIQPGAAP